MQVVANAIQFRAVKCSECGWMPDFDMLFGMNDIIDSGVPICQECGEDMEISDVAVLNTEASNNSLTEEETNKIALEITEKGQDIIGIALESNTLYINSLTDDELNSDENFMD